MPHLPKSDMSTQFPGDRIDFHDVLRHDRCAAARVLRRVVRSCFTLGSCLALMLVSPVSAAADQWTSLTGTSTIQAEFIGLWEGKVILERPDGARLAVEKSKLDAVSRIRADDLAAEQEKARQQRIAELRSQAEAAHEIAPAQPAGPYEPWPDAAGLEETIEHVAEQLQAGHPRVLWDALPAAYQQDLQSLVHLYADRADGEQHATSLRLTSQFARLLHKQREFILNYPKMAMLPPEARAIIEEVYTPVVGILAELNDPDTFSLENLKSTDLDALIAQKDEAIGGYVATLIDMVPEDQNPLSSILSGDALQVEMEGEDRGRVALADTSGESKEAVFVRVDGRWLPEAMASEWEAKIAEAREDIENLPETMEQTRQQVAMLALTVGPALARLEEAGTQQEFNAILDSYVDLILAMIPQGGMGRPGDDTPQSPFSPGNNGIGPAGPAIQGGAGPAGGHGAQGQGAAGPAGGHGAQGGAGAQGPGGGHDAPGGEGN